MFITPGGTATAPKRTCPSCLSGVSNWDTTCPYCKAPLPPVTPIPGPAAAGARSGTASSSPGTAPWIHPAAARRNSTLKALVISTLVLNIAAIVASVILIIVPMASLIRQGIPQTQIVATLLTDPSILIRMQMMGVVVTMFSGYLAGWLGRDRELYHAGMLGLISLFLGALGTLAMPPRMHALPAWYWVAGGVLAIPSALLGGLLARVLRGSRTEADPAGGAEPGVSAPGEAEIDVRALWVDRRRRYLYVPLIFSLGCYLVPPEGAERLDRDLRLYRWVALPALIFVAWPGLDPLERVIRFMAAASLICIGYLWRSRALVPVTVDKADIVKRPFSSSTG